MKFNLRKLISQFAGTNKTIFYEVHEHYPKRSRTCYETLAEAISAFVQLTENGKAKGLLIETTYNYAPGRDRYEAVAEVDGGELICIQPSIQNAIEAFMAENEESKASCRM